MDRKRHQQNKKRSRLQKMRDDKEKRQSQPQNEQLVEEMKASLLHYQDLEKDLASALSKIEEQTAQIEERDLSNAEMSTNLALAQEAIMELKTKLGEEKAKIVMVEVSNAELSKELTMAQKTIEEQAAKIEALEKMQPKPRSSNRILRILFPCL